MTKRQLNEIVLRFLAATPKVIVGARGHDGACKFCGSPRGIQHSRACPTWGLIHARIEHHLICEGSTRPTEVDPDPVMQALEAGSVPISTAPKLEFAPSASVGTERWPT